jgi:hypothetical protein
VTWQEHHCWSLTCDVCAGGWSDLDGEPHFDDRYDLELYAKQAGWTITPLRAVCPNCTLEELCSLTDHTWGPWTQLEASPLSADKTTRRVRFCVVCTTGEYDPPPSRRR